MLGKICDTCKHYHYDRTTGTGYCDMLEADKLNDWEVEHCFCECEEGCSKWEDAYDALEEAYIESLIK